ncbi:hypothetical protein, partial [Streptomyces sp.]|uniref:hypothetical protein n=1 Tax=Streptomyces sp. TaxID=1931 RepID=UPI002F954A07
GLRGGGRRRRRVAAERDPALGLGAPGPAGRPVRQWDDVEYVVAEAGRERGDPDDDAGERARLG